MPCRTCHRAEAASYTRHGWLAAPGGSGVPTCADCHGTHGILAASDPRSRTSPANLDVTCGHCHADVDLVQTHSLAGDAVTLYRRSVHGKAERWTSPGATCVDCHGRRGSPHVILGAGNPDSPIFFFNIPATCGRCHVEQARAYEEGSHGRRVQRGDTHAPVCTDCHGEHAITSADSPDSPVSPRRVASETCAPCHRSVLVDGASGPDPGVVSSFFASYHGMRSMTGEDRAATCDSCHDAHRVLPPGDPRSQVNPANVQSTCARCHSGISPELAAMPIHDIGGRQGFRTPAARTVEELYRAVTAVLLGLLLVGLLAELVRLLVDRLRVGPLGPRHRTSDIVRRTLLVASFLVLAISGFALVDRDAFWVRWLFGWPGGLEMRRVLHRTAAITLTAAAAWHLAWVSATRRGHAFLRGMVPVRRDVSAFAERIVGREYEAMRISLVDKAAYWVAAGSVAVLVVTGVMLWLDVQVVNTLSMGGLDVAWVTHLWQAWLLVVLAAAWGLVRRARRVHLQHRRGDRP